jgi:hypothetical protein
MIRKAFSISLLLACLAMLVYGFFFRDFLIYDNLEKFDKLKEVGVKIKLPGHNQNAGGFKVESQWFTEPELVNAMTFGGVGVYKDGRLISHYPDLRMLKGRRPCPT